ncbi:malate:quinone oxidoreductase [Pseudolysinimonas kribbensis]|uniref:Probable malate:quinone oxidoreductase n=1 Tax=Pseudolysinimonas kribbensis TaxID=433641 RepID=A0ABQ6K5S4_9MICO|nr:malate:quinone oxidoreductase [Pseudolysinimonas kribbensis]GMA94390.1 putative malate:quinone oxidoreductase [Pseudolysinimonas kribbensis]
MPEAFDVVLIGGGVMSATLGSLLQRLQPDWRIAILERLGDVALESSNPWNNAGTGHSALCELNYTPELPDGSIDITNAVKVNEQFQVSRQFWSALVEDGTLPEPHRFINTVPHMTFVWGEDNVAYLRKRFDALKDHPLFAGMEYSEDAAQIRRWAPLLIPGRAKSQPIAATYMKVGTDVDFGSLTRLLIDGLVAKGAELRYEHRVTGLRKRRDGVWQVTGRREVGGAPFSLEGRFVFVGAGGGALNLLQRSGIKEIRGYGGFPISGEFFRTDDPEIVAKHSTKVYGKAAVGSPPMSVPHLDTRYVDGTPSLLFGPYAGFSPKFLKAGSWLDLFASIRPHNLGTMIGAGLKNLDLVLYLVRELLASRAHKVESLRDFFPKADGDDWRLITAGQRVQVMKRGADGKAVIQFGTEVVASADGSIAGLLGASPGASTAVPIMLDVLARCFGDRLPGWEPELRTLIPTYGTRLSDDPARATKVMRETAAELGIPA